MHSRRKRTQTQAKTRGTCIRIHSKLHTPRTCQLQHTHLSPLNFHKMTSGRGQNYEKQNEGVARVDLTNTIAKFTRALAYHPRPSAKPKHRPGYCISKMTRLSLHTSLRVHAEKIRIPCTPRPHLMLDSPTQSGVWRIQFEGAPTKFSHIITSQQQGLGSTSPCIRRSDNELFLFWGGGGFPFL